MKNKILVIITVVLVIALILIVKYILNDESSKKLELTYEKSAGIPYKWEYEIEDDSIVTFDKSYVIKDENKGGLVGGKVYTNYVFKGLKKGTTTITFRFINFTTNEIDSEEKHTVKVDDDLNISLVAVPLE